MKNGHALIIGVNNIRYVFFTGTFLTDLTMIHTAYPDKTEVGLSANNTPFNRRTNSLFVDLCVIPQYTLSQGLYPMKDIIQH